jgi:3-oxoacyl-[acyl-carrier-protein] synthase II
MTAAVSGMGAVSGLGFGLAALWRGVEEGRDGMRALKRIAVAGCERVQVALVPGFDEPEDDGLPRDGDYGLWERYALAAAREALTEARLGAAELSRAALVIGSLRAHRDGYHDLAEVIGDRLGIAGPRINAGTACASSTFALALALDLVTSGTVDIVVAGGSDVVTRDMLAGFAGLGLLSPEKCAPFSAPAGTTLGEGAGFLVLERAESAAARGVAPWAMLRGYGLSADAYHATTPDPSGGGIARALQAALADAGLGAAAVGYVNAHGTGTENNDPAEWRALERVFGAQIAVSSSKSFLGHAQGAAGALEAIVTLLAMSRGVVPPTMHFAGARPRCPSDPIGEGRPRPLDYDAAVSVSAAFGGANGALVFARAASSAATAAERPVFVHGQGRVGPFAERVALDLRDLVPTADGRGLDASSVMLTAAVSRALDDARLQLRGRERERAGLFVGACRLSPSSGREYEASLGRRASAQAFTRIVLNAPTGACARLLALKGPTTTLAAGTASGLVAVIHAADHLARHDAADVIAAAAVDELEPESAGCDGAACVVLAARPSPVRVAGWGLAGPGQLDAAIARALAAAGVTRREISLEFFATREMTSASSAIAVARAAEAVRSGASSALVVEAGGRAAACALVLVAHAG